MDAFVVRTKRPAERSPTKVKSQNHTQSTQSESKSARSDRPTWKTVDASLLVHDDSRCAPSTKIAAFDLDETLERTKSGRKPYAATADDFKPLNEHVGRVLRALHESGYKICIFSNQGGVKSALEGSRATTVRIRLERLTETLDVPFQAFCATQINKEGKVNDPHNYRKGGDGMWRRMVRLHNGGVEPNLAECFYVGDAAGRAGDHSDFDSVFAKTVGIKFYTPEDIFVEGEAWKTS